MELNRYAVWPSQACAYKIGELKILELRKKVREELGGKFSIKEFHSIILKHGSMPLELVDSLVQIYIEQNTEY